MTEKFKNKYSTKSSRLQGYDYSQNGMYFVTICTKDREEFFGEIVNGKMMLNNIGKNVENCWKEISVHFPHAIPDEFIVMPNHVHGIIEINWNNIDEANQRVETQNFVSLHPGEMYKNKFGSQTKNLASIVRGFKIGVKKYATINEINFIWQSGYYDHIIRSNESLGKIREYIKINPEMWERDRNNVENVWM